jgi:hypothetical protein
MINLKNLKFTAQEEQDPLTLLNQETIRIRIH